MSSRAKFYVVWKGRRTGIFSDWDSCSAAVSGFTGAQYKAFATRIEAERAFAGQYQAFAGKPSSSRKWLFSPAPPIPGSCVVDAACSGSPGPVEWRGVLLPDARPLFRQGPFAAGTNNLGEFLAIFHALVLLEKQHSPASVYSDSSVAISWIKAGKCRTSLRHTSANAPLFALVARAETWLAEHPSHNPVLKWDTAAWGENPADFNRK